MKSVYRQLVICCGFLVCLSGLSAVLGGGARLREDGVATRGADGGSAATQGTEAAAETEGSSEFAAARAFLSRWGWAASWGGAVLLCVYLGVLARRLGRDMSLLREGVSRLDHRNADIELQSFTFEELRQCADDLASIGTQIQAEQGRLTKHASHDPLTGLPNRRAMENVLAKEVAAAKRSGWPISVVMADLDHFKSFNDTYGHQAGDAVLIRAAGRMASMVREMDTVARFGGEEFAVILPNASLSQAAEIAEQLRDALRCDPMVVDNETLRISASFGVAELQACGAASPEALIKRADLALYEAKEAGRDTVVSASQAPRGEDSKESGDCVEPAACESPGRRPEHITETSIDADTMALMGSTYSMLRLIPDRHRVAHDMIQQMVAILECRDAALYVSEGGEDHLVRVAAVGACDDDVDGSRVADPELTSWFTTMRSTECGCTERSVDLYDIGVRDEETGHRMVRIPLVVGDEWVGVLVVQDAPPARMITHHHHSLLSAVVLIGGSALRVCDGYSSQERHWIGLTDMLCQMAQRENSYKRDHAERVSMLSVQIAQSLGQSSTEALRTLRLAAMLHDLGETAVPKRIREKKGKLRMSERAQLQQHPRLGAQMVSGLSSMSSLGRLIRHHHEHHDGSGYPDGLTGDEIPWESRVIAVASAYVAMTSERPYRAKMPESVAMSRLLSSAGTQFDPEVVDAFMTCQENESLAANLRECAKATGAPALT